MEGWEEEEGEPWVVEEQVITRARGRGAGLSADWSLQTHSVSSLEPGVTVAETAETAERPPADEPIPDTFYYDVRRHIYWPDMSPDANLPLNWLVLQYPSEDTASNTHAACL